MSARVVVVGAGVIGSSVALRLAESGARVTIVEAERPGAGTSGTSFAWIGASAPALRPYFDLNVAGVAGYRRLVAELGPRPWHVSTGSLVWNADPDETAALAENVGELRDLGYSAALLTPERALALEPSLRIAPEVELAAFHPDEGWADGAAMAADLVALARDRGAEVHAGAAVTGIDETGASATVRLAGGERLEADRVVLCAGRRTGRLARLAGSDLPMVEDEGPGSYLLGLLATTAQFPGAPGRVVIADGRMIRPAGGGRVLLHTDEHDQLLAADDPEERVAEIADRLLDAARPYVAMPEATGVERFVVGRRSLTADLLPAVGWLPGRARIYAAVTHSGITIAPALGELVAAEVAVGGEEPLLDPFRPDRFALTSTTEGRAAV